VAEDLGAVIVAGTVLLLADVDDPDISVCVVVETEVEVEVLVVLEAGIGTTMAEDEEATEDEDVVLLVGVLEDIDVVRGVLELELTIVEVTAELVEETGDAGLVLLVVETALVVDVLVAVVMGTTKDDDADELVELEKAGEEVDNADELVEVTKAVEELDGDDELWLALNVVYFVLTKARADRSYLAGYA